MRILLVEDSLTQAEKLKYMLEQHGYLVSVVVNGEDALLWLQEEKPIVIISDVIMPKMDGYQLCRRLKADNNLKEIPLILLTSLSDPKSIIKGLECGADNFLTKPYKEEFLISRVENVLANKAMRHNTPENGPLIVSFNGEQFNFNSERHQILDFLLSIYENVVQRNTELEESYKEVKKASDTIKLLGSNYRALLENNADAMVVISASGIVQYINPAAEELIEGNAQVYFSKLLPEYTVPLGRNQELGIEVAGGGEITVEMRVVETNWEGENAYLATLRDVTENVNLREKLRSLSLTDELTGLYNRRGFFALAGEKLKSADLNRKNLYLFYFDLDNFKWVNDALGHNVGDEVLKCAANILRDTFRDSDYVTRIGGDEFAVLAISPSSKFPEKIIARLNNLQLEYNQIRTNDYQLEMSIGYTVYNDQNPFTIEELLHQADKLMYENKKGKRTKGKTT
jgi:two-component system cell cycle response regulator